MILYREASLQDAESIALLHARSWQQHYRGIWRDAFLDGGVIENRLEAWKNRLQHPKANQQVIVAEEKHAICGFACVLLNNDPVWDTLLDNLHVLTAQKGKGIGTTLIKLAAQWTYTHNPGSKFYLWVLEKNINARKFYEKLGASNYELVSMEDPDGGFSDTCRYVWTDLKKLM